MKKIGELIKDKKVYFAEPHWTVTQTAKYMKEYDIGAVAVLDDGRVCGIFTERDIMRQVVAENLDPQTTSLNKVMTREVITAEPDDSYEECLLKMQQQHCRHLPVIVGSQLIGIISLRDLLQVDAMEKFERVKLLDYLLRYEIEVGEYD
ncbi:MAG: CBS domain-containing protein [Acidobacteriota bacterium]